MNINLIVSFGLFLSVGAMACENPPVELPGRLACIHTDCILGENCPEEDQANAILTKLNSSKSKITHEIDGRIQKLTVQQRCEDDFVKMSVVNGDHIDEFKFTKKDMKRLHEGRRSDVRSLRTLGYREGNVDRTDAVLVMECVAVD